jgi:hypothetical protein
MQSSPKRLASSELAPLNSVVGSSGKLFMDPSDFSPSIQTVREDLIAFDSPFLSEPSERKFTEESFETDWNSSIHSDVRGWFAGSLAQALGRIHVLRDQDPWRVTVLEPSAPGNAL